MQCSVRELEESIHRRATHDEVILQLQPTAWAVESQDSPSRASRGGRRSNPMRFFGFGKKRVPDTTRPLPTPTGREAQPLPSPASGKIIVYGTNDGARCRQVRALLETRGYTYQDVRVDEDLGTRSWLHRTTGDDALPKVFVGAECYGGFEDLQVLVFDGRFDRILRGEADQDHAVDESAALKEEMSATAISILLRRGEILTMREGEMAMDVWAEPLANPPRVYYEGTPHAIDALESIAEQIVTRLTDGDITVSWKEDA